MKVLIVSDTHNREHNFLEVVKLEKPLDFIVHLGDIGKLEDYIEEMTGCACFAVRGNNDWGSQLPTDSIIMLGKHRTFLSHGHQYGVSYSYEEICDHAKNIECDIALFGHTHIPYLGRKKGVILMNPGSISLPRQPGKQPSYGVATISEDGEVTFESKYL